MRPLTRITLDPAVMRGRACIRGLRVTVGTVVGLLADGRTCEQVLEAYPYLEREDIDEALRYAAWRADEREVTLSPVAASSSMIDCPRPGTKRGARRGPRYPKEEFARRGEAIYLEQIRPKLTKKDVGKFVAIDIEAGEFEVSRSDRAAVDKLYKRIPDAQLLLMRIGYRATYSMRGGLGKPWGVPGEPD